MDMKLGACQSKLDSCLAGLAAGRFIPRFLAKDHTLWKDDPDHARVVANRMGWLGVAGDLLARAGELSAFADEIRQAGFRHVVLLGMGGSSLGPDVLRQTFGRRRGYPDLIVLDSTDPGMITLVNRRIDPEKTLFIVASKSGSTIESQMFYQYYAAKVGGDHFAAITDPGTSLERLARERGFRRVFSNPSDIGGRYSVLSYFGMVPAALCGIEAARLLERGERMTGLLRAGLPPESTPPVLLGAALGTLALAGRNKVTFMASPPIATFGYWVEQLIAESTGKEGQGIVPIEGEPAGAPSRYRKDRVFVHLALRGSRDTAIRTRLAALRRAGHPCITVPLDDLYDLGTEFQRWEIATAVAASVLGIDPFDEPNVKESKDNTGRVLEQYRTTGALPATAPDLREKGIDIWAPAYKQRRGLAPLFDEFCRSVRPGDYIALMAYLPMEENVDGILGKIRVKLRDRCRTATTLGFGPRFLHSTGQLHKGGAGNGLFIQITAEKTRDHEIPGENFSFGVLQAAQAAGDYLSLTSRGYRTVRLHLGRNTVKDLKVVAARI